MTYIVSLFFFNKHEILCELEVCGEVLVLLLVYAVTVLDGYGLSTRVHKSTSKYGLSLLGEDERKFFDTFEKVVV